MDREAKLLIVDEISLLMSKIKQIKAEINYLNLQKEVLLSSKEFENRSNVITLKPRNKNSAIEA